MASTPKEDGATMLSYNEFVADISIGYENHLQVTVPNRQERYGQYFFNMLRVVRPDVAEVLRGSMIDPFYLEMVTPTVHIQIETLWNSLHGHKYQEDIA
jgi:hypothetical protein